MVWYGMVWGMVWYGMVWYGMVRIVPIGLEFVCSRLLLVHGVCLNSPK